MLCHIAARNGVEHCNALQNIALIGALLFYLGGQARRLRVA